MKILKHLLPENSAVEWKREEKHGEDEIQQVVPANNIQTKYQPHGVTSRDRARGRKRLKLRLFSDTQVHKV